MTNRCREDEKTKGRDEEEEEGRDGEEQEILSRVCRAGELRRSRGVALAVAGEEERASEADEARRGGGRGEADEARRNELGFQADGGSGAAPAYIGPLPTVGSNGRQGSIQRSRGGAGEG